MVLIMYEELFQTPDRPFRATPDVRFYFPFDSVEQTRQTVLRVIRRAEGPAAVMAGIGLGKSLLAQVLADDLSDRFDIVRLHATRLCSRRAMLQNILFELQMPYRDLSEGELRLSLMERMEPSPDHAADGLVLIVDEAQTLPTKLLEELRLITNFARQGQARARMVLLGSLQLEETLALPEMGSFNQRLAARCFLQPMNRVQTADFVRHQFACAQVDPKQIITRDALENVYVASEGIPRLANQVMDHALILAIANDQYPISAALIQEAWSDLQQLPMSWNHHEPADAMPVEFGSIDELDQDFELEPEGADDLPPRITSNMHWPAPSDLEDFGPTTLPAATLLAASLRASPSHAATSLATASAATSNHEIRPSDRVSSPSTDPANDATTSARVVFDASTLFAERSQPATGPGRINQSMHPHTQQPSEHPSVEMKSAGMVASEAGPQSQAANSSVHSPTRASDRTSQQTVSSTQPRTMQVADPDSDHDLFIFPEDEEQESYELDVSNNLFTAWNPTPGSYTFEVELPAGAANPSAGKMQIDQSIDEPMAIPMPLARMEEPVVSDPFGQDFDEEFTVDASDVRRWQERQRQRKLMPSTTTVPPSSETSMRTADDCNADCSMGDCNVPPENGLVENSFMPAEQLVVQPNYTENSSSDGVSMATTGAVDERLQNEIEDLISQLNFSAFSVEIESVEQVSPEFMRHAAGANVANSSEMRGGSDPVSYPITHGTHSQATETNSFDDDRDLLVIEEEVPASVRHQSMSPSTPTVGTLSYPELFQQLRG